MSSEESLKKLYEAYWSTQKVCRPDEYQMRMNSLTISLAEHILIEKQLVVADKILNENSAVLKKLSET